MFFCFVVFFKQKTAYEMRISDWSSDVCSSDLKFLDSIVGVTVHRAAAGDDNQRTLEILVRPFARACELDFFTVLLALVADESDIEFGLALGKRHGAAVDADRLRMIADTPGGRENDGAAGLFDEIARNRILLVVAGDQRCSLRQVGDARTKRIQARLRTLF